jgi:hypothetical protein
MTSETSYPEEEIGTEFIVWILWSVVFFVLPVPCLVRLKKQEMSAADGSFQSQEILKRLLRSKRGKK